MSIAMLNHFYKAIFLSWKKRETIRLKIRDLHVKKSVGEVVVGHSMANLNYKDRARQTLAY